MRIACGRDGHDWLPREDRDVANVEHGRVEGQQFGMTVLGESTQDSAMCRLFTFRRVSGQLAKSRNGEGGNNIRQTPVGIFFVRSGR